MMRYRVIPLLDYENALLQAKSVCPQILIERYSSHEQVMQRRLTAYLALAELCGGSLPKMVWDENGKPYFEGSSLFCSISHTDTGAAAVIADFPVGIDLQILTDRGDRLAERVCGDIEHVAMRQESDPALRNALFTRIWSGKEAAVKVCGKGLGMIGLKSIEVDLTAQTASIGDTVYTLCYPKTELADTVCCIAKMKE